MSKRILYTIMQSSLLCSLGCLANDNESTIVGAILVLLILIGLYEDISDEVKYLFIYLTIFLMVRLVVIDPVLLSHSIILGAFQYLIHGERTSTNLPLLFPLISILAFDPTSLNIVLFGSGLLILVTYNNHRSLLVPMLFITAVTFSFSIIESLMCIIVVSGVMKIIQGLERRMTWV